MQGKKERIEEEPVLEKVKQQNKETVIENQIQRRKS
jgi:hypothetical protein